MIDLSNEDQAVEALAQGNGKAVVTRTDGGGSSADRAQGEDALRLIHVLERLMSTLEDLHQSVNVIRSEAKEERDRQATESKALLASIQQLGVERNVFTQMHDRLRDLQEKFHEREVLMPIFHRLIALADRTRSEIRALRNLLKQAGQGAPIEITLIMRQLVQSRQNDLVELEECLAQHSVEKFQSASDAFNPQSQTCLQRVPTPLAQNNGKIAERIQPGYRRNDVVVRPERVNVYVSQIQPISNKEMSK